MRPDFLSKAQRLDFGKIEWLLLVDPHLDGKLNMDRDGTLLEWACSDSEAAPVLRFFQWEPPAISIGYGQPFSQINLELCKRECIPVVKRPTGGRAIYHHTEFTYSITLPPAHPLSKRPVLEAFNEISRALALGLQNLGIRARLSKGDARSGAKNPSCFSSTSRYELVIEGKKLVGSAQRRKHNAVLQQGSIIAGPQYLKLADFVAGDSEIIRQELSLHSTCMQAVLGKIPEYDEFVKAMVSGFEKTFCE